MTFEALTEQPYDVVVIGGGATGCSAAIAAGRAGKSVLLVERLPFLGGTSTAVLDTFYGYFTPGERSIKVVGGIADDVTKALEELGTVLRRPNSFGAGTGITYLPAHLKVVWERLVVGAGADVLLHTMLQDVVATDGRVTEIIVATKAGLRRVAGKVFIDASGDADLCHFAGFAYETAGITAPAQTLTTTFRMVNVDNARRATVKKAQVNELMAAAAETGAYELPRREGSDHITPIDGVTATIMTRLPSTRENGGRLINATDPGFLSQSEMAGRQQALDYVRFLIDRVPGYENARMIEFGSAIGVRETRRVIGDYWLTGEDVLAARQFDDQIGLCGAPIEDHAASHDTKWEYLPDGSAVGIPFASLIVRDAQNVLVAGRCFSAEHRAHAAVRSIAQCMVMGQAAGTGAALAVSGKGGTRDVAAAALAERLRDTGAVISLDQLEMA